MGFRLSEPLLTRAPFGQSCCGSISHVVAHITSTHRETTVIFSLQPPTTGAGLESEMDKILADRIGSWALNEDDIDSMSQGSGPIEGPVLTEDQLLNSQETTTAAKAEDAANIMPSAEAALENPPPAEVTSENPLPAKALGSQEVTMGAPGQSGEKKKRRRTRRKPTAKGNKVDGEPQPSTSKVLVQFTNQQGNETPTGQSKLSKSGTQPVNSEQQRLKRQRSGSTQEQASKKPRGIGGKVYADLVKDDLTVLFVHTDNAAGLLTREHKDLIRSAILAEIDQLTTSAAGWAPVFEGFMPAHFGLLVSCADVKTRDWIHEVAGRLKPWEGASLRVLNSNEIPSLTRVDVFIPDPVPETKSILMRLQTQNRGMLTGEWRVLNRVICPKGGCLLYLGIPDGSVTLLRELGLKPFFGLGRVNFRFSKSSQRSGK